MVFELELKPVILTSALWIDTVVPVKEKALIFVPLIYKETPAEFELFEAPLMLTV